MDEHLRLGEFLRSRRARLRPERVGLDPIGRRRVEGLRRGAADRLAAPQRHPHAGRLLLTYTATDEPAREALARLMAPQVHR